MKKIERAIVSVFDKNNIIEFVRSLTSFGIEILSTGGTGRLLQENGIDFVKISDYTDSPEMFDGRVKTLHPKIEGGILYRRDLNRDIDDALKYNIPPIDMVVCNLYQFKKAIERAADRAFKRNQLRRQVAGQLKKAIEKAISSLSKGWTWTCPTLLNAGHGLFQSVKRLEKAMSSI